jgi:hypothetical protein|nr:MAG TPA: DNA REPAIR HELICASE RAD25, SSL2, PRE-INITIATION COMPLEX, RNA polymerase.0A [Caudoviricetes sp.]
MTFNEYERAEELDEKQKFSDNIYQDGTLLLRYYKTNGFTKEEAEQKLFVFFKNINGKINEEFKKQFLSDIMNIWDSAQIIENNPVYFYKEEMDVIRTIKRKIERKILFALMYIQKASGQELFEASVTDINRLCIKRVDSNTMYDCLHELEENGFTKYSNFKGENKIQIVHPLLNCHYTSEPVITIIDKHNIMNYYWNYVGEGKFAICKNCGKLVPVTSFHVDYCEKCAKEKYLEKNVKYNKKRNNLKTTTE